jgi:hypothetical protein
MADPKAPDVPALVVWPGVEILATGQWDLSSGPAVDAAACPAVGPPIIKLGHTDDRFTPGDGEPAIGRVKNLTLAAEGNKITGDLAGMPGWLGKILPSAYPARSIEGAYSLVCQIGHTHPFAITALALLGVTPPGVGVLSGLEDVAALYGVTATGQHSAQAWALRSGDPMTGIVIAAGVTTEDVRRAYYDAPSTTFAMWITEMQLDPPQLIVADESTNNIYRVPVTIKGEDIEFGDPVQVSVEYQDVPAKKAASTGQRLRFASSADSRKGIDAAWDAGTAQKNLGDSPTSAQLKALYALPGDTKSDSKLPHHDVGSDGKVGAANDDGCSAAIGAINGGRGGLKGVSAADLKKAYNHLAAHLKADGKEAPDYSGPAAAALERVRSRAVKVKAQAGDKADDDVKAMIAGLDATLDEASDLTASVDRTSVTAEVGQALDLITAAESLVDEIMEMLGIDDPDDEDEVAAKHGKNAGAAVKHSHAHAAYGAQGTDMTHSHEHEHPAGTARHDHHAPAAKRKPPRATNPKGAAEMDFSDEQMAALRAKLGKADDADLTAEEILAAISEPGAPVSASKVPPGAILLDREEWEGAQRQIREGVEARSEQLRSQRDHEIDKAIAAGKFSLSRRPHWERVWDADPDGTKAILGSLTPGVVPVSDIGAPGGPDDDLLPDEFARLFPPEPARSKTG